MNRRDGQRTQRVHVAQTLHTGETMPEERGWLKQSLKKAVEAVAAWPQWKRDLQAAIDKARSA